MCNIWNEKKSTQLTIHLSFKTKVKQKPTEITFDRTYLAQDIINCDGNWIQNALIDVKEFLKQLKVSKRDYIRIINHYVGSFHDYNRSRPIITEKHIKK